MRGLHLCRGRALGRERTINSNLGACRFLEEFLSAGERQIGILKLSRRFGNSGLLCLDVGLERWPLKTIEEFPLLDFGSVLKQPLFKEGIDPRY